MRLDHLISAGFVTAILSVIATAEPPTQEASGPRTFDPRIAKSFGELIGEPITLKPPRAPGASWSLGANTAAGSAACLLTNPFRTILGPAYESGLRGAAVNSANASTIDSLRFEMRKKIPLGGGALVAIDSHVDAEGNEIVAGGTIVGTGYTPHEAFHAGNQTSISAAATPAPIFPFFSTQPLPNTVTYVWVDGENAPPQQYTPPPWIYGNDAGDIINRAAEFRHQTAASDFVRLGLGSVFHSIQDRIDAEASEFDANHAGGVAPQDEYSSTFGQPSVLSNGSEGLNDILGLMVQLAAHFARERGDRKTEAEASPLKQATPPATKAKQPPAPFLFTPKAEPPPPPRPDCELAPYSIPGNSYTGQKCTCCGAIVVHPEAGKDEPHAAWCPSNR